MYNGYWTYRSSGGQAYDPKYSIAPFEEACVNAEQAHGHRSRTASSCCHGALGSQAIQVIAKSLASTSRDRQTTVKTHAQGTRNHESLTCSHVTALSSLLRTGIHSMRRFIMRRDEIGSLEMARKVAPCAPFVCRCSSCAKTTSESPIGVTTSSRAWPTRVAQVPGCKDELFA